MVALLEVVEGRGLLPGERVEAAHHPRVAEEVAVVVSDWRGLGRLGEPPV